MNPMLRRIPSLLVPFAASAAVARAHPGHEGHELTWDFQHLVQHPLATGFCLAVVAGMSWVVWKLLRRASAAADHSLRESQASRGK